VRRAAAVLTIAALLAIGGAALALRLGTDAGTDTLFDHDSGAFRGTEQFNDQFGDEPVRVLVKGDLPRLVLTKNLATLLKLEGCLSGNVPPSAKGYPDVCDEIQRLKPSKAVFGPATFINQAAAQIQQAVSSQTNAALADARAAGRAAEARARRQGLSDEEVTNAGRTAAGAVLQRTQADLLQLAVRYGIRKLPQIDDPEFVSGVVFDDRRPPGTPKARFSGFFPSPNSALISIRMQPGLSEDERNEAIGLYEEAVRDPEFKLDAGSYVVSGAPVVVQGMAEALSSAIVVLLVAALILMALALLVVFRPPLRLLPVGVALVAAGLTFGALSAAGGALTMASIAVLPVLVGLAVDYAIQFQARYNERADTGEPAGRAAVEAARRGAPVIGTAAVATVVGFAVLQLSPVPMVRSFGLLLVIGVALAFLTALTAGFAAMSLARRGGSRRGVVPRVGVEVGPATRGAAPRRAQRLVARAAEMRAWGWRKVRSLGKAGLAVSIESPGRVLAVGALLAACGWIASARTDVASDIRELVPGDLPALQGLNELQERSGFSGEVDVLVRSDDLTDPAVINWMRDYRQRVLEENGFVGDIPTCEQARLCPAASLADLFTSEVEDAERVKAVIGAVPPYTAQGVIEIDPRSGEIGDLANIGFGIKVMPLDEQKQLIDSMRREINPPGTENDPPAGVDAEVTGLPALAADASSDLSGSRYWLTLAGLVLVALALLAIYRSASRALVPLVPIVFATGWAALVVAASDIPLNPMSATLGALVIAIATEFSVILAARYREQREAGNSLGESLRHAYSRTGAAVLASGVTAIAGFAALIASDITMLRDFGIVTVIDLGVALIGVMLVLPAALVWAEESATRMPAGADLRARLVALLPPRFAQRLQLHERAR
jgi:hydrophobe/amphiphile efflux-3 (HAE3) family protein